MTITYPANTHIDYSPFPATNLVAKAIPERRGFWRRALAALMEARIKEAEREVSPYHHLIPAELEAAGRRISPRNEDALPFVR